MKTKQLTIDFKSTLIGLLGGILVVTLLGANGSGYEDVTCKSLTVVDDFGKPLVKIDKSTKGGEVIIYNEDEGLVGFFGTNTNGDCQMRTLNYEGKTTVFIGARSDGMGFIDVNNQLGKRLASIENGFMTTYNDQSQKTGYLGTSSGGAGLIEIYNKTGVKTVYLGTATDEGGTIILKDRYGTNLFTK